MHACVEGSRIVDVVAVVLPSVAALAADSLGIVGLCHVAAGLLVDDVGGGGTVPVAIAVESAC